MTEEYRNPNTPDDAKDPRTGSKTLCPGDGFNLEGLRLSQEAREQLVTTQVNDFIQKGGPNA